MARIPSLMASLLATLVLLVACGGKGTSGPDSALGEAGQDDAVATALADVEVATAGVAIARHVLYGEADPDRAALQALPGRRAFVCAYQDKPQRLCETGVGEDLAASIDAAAAALKKTAGRQIVADEKASIRLKLDVATSAVERTFTGKYDKPKARRVATYGYFARTDGGDLSYLLPSELLEMGLYNKKKGFARDKIRKKLVRRNSDVDDLPDKFTYEEFETVAWVEKDPDEGASEAVFRLYRLHPYEFADATPDVMLQRMVWAADYLISSITADGKIRYRYKTPHDKDSSSYNLLRHGGTTYSILQVYDRTRFEPYLKASVQAMHYLFENCDSDQRTGPWFPSDHPDFGDSLFIVSPATQGAPDGMVKLGGAGLALVMIDQYVEGTGDTETYREQAMGLARFIVASQKEDGEFIYYPARFPGGPLTSHSDSPYYPGEAILGLVRLYSWDRNPLWLETGIRGADWLIDERDAGKGPSSLANDHWLMLALSYLYLYTEDSRYLDHSIALCHAVEHQYRKNEKYWAEFPDFQGGYYNPPRSTPAATRGEGLGAVLEACHLSGQECGWIQELLEETVRHEMLSQYDPDMSFWMRNPAKAFGGWNGGLLDMDVRNDFVQHNMSSVLGLERVQRRAEGVTLPGGPGWMEKRLAGTEFPGIPAAELATLREASLRYRGPTIWEDIPPAATDSTAAPKPETEQENLDNGKLEEPPPAATDSTAAPKPETDPANLNFGKL